MIDWQSVVGFLALVFFSLYSGFYVEEGNWRATWSCSCYDHRRARACRIQPCNHCFAEEIPPPRNGSTAVMKQTPIIRTSQKNSFLCCALACTAERFLLAAMIIRRICDPNRSARSCLSQQMQPGGTCPRVQRVFGYVHILEIARQCCVYRYVCCVELGYACPLPCSVLI